MTSGAGRPDKIYTWLDVWASFLDRLERPPVRAWAVMLAVLLFANLPRGWVLIGAALVVAGIGVAIILRRVGNRSNEGMITIRGNHAPGAREEAPSNNKMKEQTKLAQAVELRC